MPVYEYRCSQCGHRFEKLVRTNDEQPACPMCHSQKAERVPSVSMSSGCGSIRDWGRGFSRYT